MTRETAIQLAATGAPLTVEEVGLIFGITRGTAYGNEKRGLYDVFRVNPPLGPRRYSGVLLTRYLHGEPLYEPTFGRKRKAS